MAVSQSAQTDGAVGGLRGDTADLLLSMETVGTLQGHRMCAKGLSQIGKVKRQTVTPGDERERERERESERERETVATEAGVYFAGV